MSAETDGATTLPAPLPPGARAAVGEIDGIEHLVLCFDPRVRAAWPTCLTQAERAVAELLVRGHSNDQIAQARGRSARTVANQIASVFRKLGVGSRMQLSTWSRGTASAARAASDGPVHAAAEVATGRVSRSRRSARARSAT